MEFAERNWCGSVIVYQDFASTQQVYFLVS